MGLILKNKVSSEMNLTSGNLFKKVFKFTFPLMLTSIFQLLYTTIDLWTVSQFGEGSISMAAIGTNNPTINLVIIFLINLAVGSSVSISIAKGSNNVQKAENILHTSILIALVGGVIVGIIGLILGPHLLSWMGTPDYLIDKAVEYLNIFFLGVPFMAIYNFGAQMLRSLGDSKRPLYFLIIAGFSNVLFDLIFVILFKMDVKGVALATIISELISASLVIIYFIYSKTTFVNLKLGELKIHKEELKEILKIGVPSGLQGMCFCIPNLLIQSSLYTISDYYINGILIGQKEIIIGASASAQIEGYIFVIIDCFAVANVSFTGQNYGAKKIDNIRKCFWLCFLWMSIFWVGCFSISMLFHNNLFEIFIEEEENLILDNALLAGFERLKILVSTYLLDGLMSLMGSYLKGLKRSVEPAIITMVGCCGTRIVFLLTLFKMDYFHTVFWLYAAFPISWTLVCLVYIPIILYNEKRQFKLLMEE